jgi:type I restriction enzyme M protein
MFEQAFRSIDDVLWKEAGCTTELDYTEQTSWLLFLKYLDDLGKLLDNGLIAIECAGMWDQQYECSILDRVSRLWTKDTGIEDLDAA